MKSKRLKRKMPISLKARTANYIYEDDDEEDDLLSILPVPFEDLLR